jgi:hypothetical protein
MLELELEQRTNTKFLLNLARVEAKSERCYCKLDNAMKKTAVYKWVAVFLRDKKVALTQRDQHGQQKEN